MPAEQIGNNNAEEYSQHSKPQEMTADSVIKSLIADKLQAHHTILDVGCGTGGISARLAKMVRQGLVIAYDILEEAIIKAKTSFPPTEYPNLSFYVGNAETFFIDKKFDWIVSFNVLHWLKPDAQCNALKQFCKMLNPDNSDSSIVITLGMRHEPLWSIVEDITSNPASRWAAVFRNYENPRAFYEPKQYKQLMLDAGLEAQAIQVKSLTYYFPDPEALKKFVASWLPQINVVKKEERNEFMNDIIKIYIEKRSPEPQGYGMTFRVMEVLGRKLNLEPTCSPTLQASLRKAKL